MLSKHYPESPEILGEIYVDALDILGGCGIAHRHQIEIAIIRAAGVRGITLSEQDIADLYEAIVDRGLAS